MDDLLNLFARLEQSPRPLILATLLKVDGAGPVRAGARRILAAAGGAPVTALDEALQGVAVTGRTRMLAGVSGPELDPWRGGVLLERMVPGKLPPWMHFCAQVLRRGGACVMATVGALEGDVPYALGDRFVYDERNHGLLPMDGRFSLDLQRGCEKVREAGQPAWKRFDLTGGSLGICLEPLP